MLNSLQSFFSTRDWKMIFLRFSAFMFWLSLLFALSIAIYQPLREDFLDWIILNNQVYFTDYLNWLLDNPFYAASNQPEIQNFNSISV